MRVETDPLGVVEILNDAAALVAARPVSFVAALLIYAAFGIWTDQQYWSWSQHAVILVLSVLLAGGLQYLVLRRALGGGQGGWAGAIIAPMVAVVVHAVIWLGSGIAYLLFLIPGLYISGRMSAAVGMAVAERTGVVGSIVGSWRRTRGSTWPLIAVQALLLLPTIALLCMIWVAWYIDYGVRHLDEATMELALLTNVLLGAMTMAGWAVAGAVYRLTAPGHHRIDDVFA